MARLALPAPGLSHAATVVAGDNYAPTSMDYATAIGEVALVARLGRSF